MTASWLNTYFPDEPLVPMGFCLFIVLGVFGNAIAAMVYMGKHALRDGLAPGAFCYILLSLLNCEFLVFLTDNLSSQRLFRSLDVLRTLFEDVPILCLCVRFFLLHGTILEHDLVFVCFCVTTFVAVLKTLRVLIINAVGTPKHEAKVGYLMNLRYEDVLLVPVHTLHWVLCLILIFVLEHLAFRGSFAHEWMRQQFYSLSGFNESHALNATLAPEVFGDPNEVARLTALVSARPFSYGVSCDNATIYLADVNATANATSDLTGSFGSGEAVAFDACPLSIPLLVSQLVFRHGTSDPTKSPLWSSVVAPALSPAAVDLVEYYAWMSHRFNLCFWVFFAAFGIGCLSGPLLLVLRYLRAESFASSFGVDIIAYQSIYAAFVALGSGVSGGFLNGLSQDARGYSYVKRDTSIAHLCSSASR